MSDFIKADEGKLQWSLMPFEQLEDVVRVLMNGAKNMNVITGKSVTILIVIKTLLCVM